MSWASSYIEKLIRGETVEFRPRGHSMTPRIKSGQLCTVEPILRHTIEIGDVVLCKVNGSHYIHLVSAIHGPRFRISNNHGHVNGWISIDSIFGKLTNIAP